MNAESLSVHRKRAKVEGHPQRVDDGSACTHRRLGNHYWAGGADMVPIEAFPLLGLVPGQAHQGTLRRRGRREKQLWGGGRMSEGETETESRMCFTVTMVTKCT